MKTRNPSVIVTPSPKQCYRMHYRTPEGKRVEAKPSIITNPPTLLTPTRNSRKLDSISSDAFSKRQRTCTGPPVLMKMEYGRQCWICKNKTKWMCQGCHVFACHGSTCKLDAANDHSRQVYSIPDPKLKPNKGEKLFFFETCFILSHPTLQIKNLTKPMLPDL